MGKHKTSLSDFAEAAKRNCRVCALPGPILTEINAVPEVGPTAVMRWLFSVHGIRLDERTVRRHRDRCCL